MSELARTAPASLPAARQLAEVVPRRGGVRVRLPEAHAREALLRFLSWSRIDARLLEGPRAADGIPALASGDWALLVPAAAAAEPRFPLVTDGARRVASRDGGRFLCLLLPRGVVEVRRRGLRRLLAALEEVKPEERDDRGHPFPWVAPRPRRAGTDPGEIEDDVITGADDDDTSPDLAGGPEERTIRVRWIELCDVAGIPCPPLRIGRAREERRGFVTGRIALDRRGTPLWVGIVACPNADLAEVLATLVHELAHALSGERGHGEAFRLAMIELAERAFGAHLFLAARQAAAGPKRLLERWIASGVRAALQGRQAPHARDPEELQLARAIRRIGKLRALAVDQVGRPEGIAATGQASDLVVAYGLEEYEVAVEATLPDEMLDRWLLLGSAAVWKRRLVDCVARWFDVMALSIRDRMHLFGRHADLVATEYVFGACVDRIEGACAEHLERWKRQGARAPGAVRRERTSFCDSAVEAFREKLEEMRRGEGATSVDDRPPAAGGEAFLRAEAFARAEHVRRGIRWVRDAGRSYRPNRAGAELGRSLQVARGVEAGRPLRLLPGARA